MVACHVKAQNLDRAISFRNRQVGAVPTRASCSISLALLLIQRKTKLSHGRSRPGQFSDGQFCDRRRGRCNAGLRAARPPARNAGRARRPGAGGQSFSERAQHRKTRSGRRRRAAQCCRTRSFRLRARQTLPRRMLVWQIRVNRPSVLQTTADTTFGTMQMMQIDLCCCLR